MKKTIAITSLALVCAASVPAVSMAATKTQSADAVKRNSAEVTGLKQGAVFTTSTIAGAVLGGPVGFILGALGGAYMGEQIEKADHADYTAWELAEAEDQIVELHTQLASANNAVENLSNVAMQSLEFQVLFHTGEDQLNTRSVKRVEALGRYLEKNPGLSVRLVGRADPRGTDEYNNVLSEHRALAVQNALETYGIESHRIERRAYGASQSTAAKGDHEAYALERRVDIEVFNPAAKGFAQLN